MEKRTPLKVIMYLLCCFGVYDREKLQLQESMRQ